MFSNKMTATIIIIFKKKKKEYVVDIVQSAN